MIRSAWLMAQASADKSSRLLADILPWLIAIVAFIIVGGVVIYLIRRWLRSGEESESIGFTLQDLRDLHARGELSYEEFAHARQQMIGRLKQPGGGSARPGKTQSPGNHEAESN
jgi:hypothetical protein